MPKKNNMNIRNYLYAFMALASVLLLHKNAYATTLHVGAGKSYTTIKKAIAASVAGDTVIVHKGIYKEGTIIIDKPIYFLGEGRPVLEGEQKYEIVSVKSSNVVIKGFIVRNSGRNAMNDPSGINVSDVRNVVIEDNILQNNYFGVHLQYATHCIVKNNIIKASQKEEHQSGNGVHCWKSDSLQIIGNKIEGHRDGIYFEFVTASIIWRNISKYNLRYGLHFMFSHNNSYITNYFKTNGAGVAVMFTKKVIMMNNTFEENWGDAAYGVLFKELTDCYLSGNRFLKNTTGIFFDGSNRIIAERNLFQANGWGMRMQANCMDNKVAYNNFLGNTFDVTTNGSLTLNQFTRNYWDKYEGYDLNKDQVGDVAYHPLSLYSVIVEKNPPAMLLYRSFMIGLLDKSEKIIPSLTPENFVDKQPHMSPYNL